MVRLGPDHGNAKFETTGSDEIAGKIKSTLLNQASSGNIETKIWALRSLSSSVLITQALDTATLQTLCQSIEDHTTDQRGDIGSLVRIEAIKAVDAIMKRTKEVDDTTLVILLSKVAGLAVEKLDRVRLQAFECLKDNRAVLS